MNTTTLHTVALALTLGFATAASAGDFDYGHPDQDLLKLTRPAATAVAAPATPAQQAAQQAAQQVAATAATLQRKPGASVSTEESRAMVGEDSGSFWLSQQAAQPRTAPAVARLEAGSR